MEEVTSIEVQNAMDEFVDKFDDLEMKITIAITELSLIFSKILKRKIVKRCESRIDDISTKIENHFKNEENYKDVVHLKEMINDCEFIENVYIGELECRLEELGDDMYYNFENLFENNCQNNKKDHQ